MMKVAKMLFCSLPVLVFLVLPLTVMAQPVPLYEGSVSSVKFDAKGVVAGSLSTVASGSVSKVVAAPNVDIQGEDLGDNLLVDLGVNMEDTVYLHAGGRLLTPLNNKAVGHLDGSVGTGVILIGTDVTFDPATETFTVGGPSSTVLIFGFAAEAKAAVRTVNDAVVNGTLKLKIMPTSAEMVDVADAQTVADVSGTGQPVFLKFKLSAVRFVPVAVMNGI